MRRRDFVLFLILEILSGILAVILFKSIADPRWAGVLAGLGFLGVGLAIVVRTWGWIEKWTLPTFWMAHVHVWVVTVPMFLVRLANWERPFADLFILGMSGAVFHRLSEGIFSLLILFTIFDWVRCQVRKKTTGNVAQP